MYKSRLRKWDAYRNNRNKKRRQNQGDVEPERRRSLLSKDPGYPESEGHCCPTSISSGKADSVTLVNFPQGLVFAEFSTNIPKATRGSGPVSFEAPDSVGSDATSIDAFSDALNFTPDSSSAVSRDMTMVAASQKGWDMSSAPLQMSLVSSQTTAINDTSQYVNNWLSNAGPHIASASAYNVPRGQVDPTIFRIPATRVDPADFVRLCSQYCRFSDLGSYEEVDTAASAAFRLFRELLRQRHKHALIALNTVLVCVLVYGKSDEAFDLMSRARDVATSFLSKSHPIVTIIDFLRLQAAGAYESMSTERFHEASEALCSGLHMDHPDRLVTGYLFAWRLSLDYSDRESQLEALQLLCKLQESADRTLGTSHLLSGAVLITKARIQHVLRMIPEAVANMKDAMLRMESVYSYYHPYVLDARSRYGDLLYVAGEYDNADREYVKCALGRVELFGRAHHRSQEAINDVEKFYRDMERNAKRGCFDNEIVLANQRYILRRSSHPFIAGEGST